MADIRRTTAGVERSHFLAGRNVGRTGPCGLAGRRGRYRQDRHRNRTEAASYGLTVGPDSTDSAK